MDACTIVSRPEFARAQVLASTFRRHHPGAAVTILLLDDAPNGLEAGPDASLLTLADVVGDQSALLATANPPAAHAVTFLPHLLRALLEERDGALVYLAPGQRVLGPLDQLFAVLERHALALVSRNGGGRVAAGAAFDASTEVGRLNPGVLALRAGSATARLLDAWPRFFADGDDGGDGSVRAWFSALPAVADDVDVVRDPAFSLELLDVLHELADDPQRLAERLTRARLANLDAFDPREAPAPDPSPTGGRPGAQAAISSLLSRHRAELLAAGYESDRHRDDPYRATADGVRFTPTIRRLMVAGILEGALSASPVTKQGRDSLYAYLNQLADRGTALGLTRLHLAIWESRSDLREAYAHIDGPDGAGFAGWLVAHGEAQEGLAPVLLPPTPELLYLDADSPPSEREPLWGVNVVGFFTAELGVGEAARLLIAGLDAAAIPALPIQGKLMPPSRAGADFTYVGPDDAAFPINILCINGDGIPVFAREAGREFFADRHTIAMWWWELTEFPAGWEQAFEHVDEVWVASDHVRDAIAPASPVPVVKVTMPVSAPRVRLRSRSQLGLPEGYLFVYVHDYHSWGARKNPEGVVEAFKRAFAPGSAKLVIKSINGDRRPDDHDRVRMAAAGHPDVSLIDSYVSAADKNAMIAACDCYVSLHRAEGFGLTIAEAMLLGKPTIATSYGGNLEFMTDANSYLVDWEPTRVGRFAGPYPRDAVWAEPDLDHAAALMRQVASDPEQARRRGERARRDVDAGHAPEVAGASMLARLSLIHRRLVEAGVRDLNVRALPALDFQGLHAAIQRSPQLRPGRRRAPLQRSVRRAIVPWARETSAHQQEIDGEIRDRLTDLDIGLRRVAASLQQQQQAHYAQSLALIRRLRAELIARDNEGDGPA